MVSNGYDKILYNMDIGHVQKDNFVTLEFRQTVFSSQTYCTLSERKEEAKESVCIYWGTDPFFNKSPRTYIRGLVG